MFTIVQTGRNGFYKELASTKFIDIAEACALGIANHQHAPESAARFGDESWLEVRSDEDEDFRPLMRVVLKRDIPRWTVERVV